MLGVRLLVVKKLVLLEEVAALRLNGLGSDGGHLRTADLVFANRLGVRLAEVNVLDAVLLQILLGSPESMLVLGSENDDGRMSVEREGFRSLDASVACLDCLLGRREVRPHEDVNVQMFGGENLREGHDQLLCQSGRRHCLCGYSSNLRAKNQPLFESSAKGQG